MWIGRQVVQLLRVGLAPDIFERAIAESSGTARLAPSARYSLTTSCDHPWSVVEQWHQTMPAIGVRGDVQRFATTKFNQCRQ